MTSLKLIQKMKDLKLWNFLKKNCQIYNLANQDLEMLLKEYSITFK
jgi:hypothetical protein